MINVIVLEKELDTSITNNKLATAKRVKELGHLYRGDYSDNQLVLKKDIVQKTEIVYRNFKVGEPYLETNKDISYTGGNNRAVSLVTYETTTRSYYLNNTDYTDGTWVTKSELIYGNYVSGEDISKIIRDRTKIGTSTPSGTVAGQYVTGKSLNIYLEAHWGTIKYRGYVDYIKFHDSDILYKNFNSSSYTDNVNDGDNLTHSLLCNGKLMSIEVRVKTDSPRFVIYPSSNQGSSYGSPNANNDNRSYQDTSTYLEISEGITSLKDFEDNKFDHCSMFSSIYSLTLPSTLPASYVKFLGEVCQLNWDNPDVTISDSNVVYDNQTKEVIGFLATLENNCMYVIEEDYEFGENSSYGTGYNIFANSKNFVSLYLKDGCNISNAYFNFSTEVYENFSEWHDTGHVGVIICQGKVTYNNYTIHQTNHYLGSELPWKPSKKTLKLPGTIVKSNDNNSVSSFIKLIENDAIEIKWTISSEPSPTIPDDSGLGFYNRI